MIVGILLSWNELTVTIALSLVVVGGAVVADFAPEIYREKRHARDMEHAVTYTISKNPEDTMQLAVFRLDQEQLARLKFETLTPQRRRHARV